MPASMNSLPLDNLMSDFDAVYTDIEASVLQALLVNESNHCCHRINNLAEVERRIRTSKRTTLK